MAVLPFSESPSFLSIGRCKQALALLVQLIWWKVFLGKGGCDDQVRKALIVVELFEEVVCFTAASGVFQLLVKLRHEVCSFLAPIAPASQRFVKEVDDWVSCELFGLEENAQFGIGLVQLADQNLLDVVSIVFSSTLVGNDSWSVNEAHVLHIVRSINKMYGFTEAILVSQHHVMSSDELEDFAYREFFPSRFQFFAGEVARRFFAIFIVNAGGIQGTAGTGTFVNNVDHCIQETFHDGTLSSRLHTTEDEGHKRSGLLQFLLEYFVYLCNKLEQFVFILREEVCKSVVFISGRGD